MDLFGQGVELLAGKIAQGEHVFLGATRIGGNQVIGQVLLLANPFGYAFKLALEGQQAVGSRFAHAFEHLRHGVFRCEFKLTGHVLGDQFLQVFLAEIAIGHHQVVPDAGADEDLAHIGQLAQFAQQFQVGLVREPKQGADLGVDTTFVLAGATQALHAAFIAIHIGRRATQIADDALEARVLAHLRGLRNNGCLGPPAHPSAFMDGNRAEITLTITAAVSGDGETDGFQCAHLALGSVERMHGVFKTQGVNLVHFLGGQRPGGWVLDHVPVGVALGEPFGRDWVVIVIKRVEHAAELVRVRADLFISRQFKIAFGDGMRKVTQAAQTGHIPTGAESPGQLQNGEIRHAIHEVIRLGVQKHGTAQAIGPEIVVRDAP